MATKIARNFTVISTKLSYKKPHIIGSQHRMTNVFVRTLSDRCDCKTQEKLSKECDKKSANKSCTKKKEKKGFFASFFSKPKRYPKEMCRLKYNADCRPDPDLSAFGGTAYKTCRKGTYVIQKDQLPTEEEEAMSSEDLLVKKIEAPLGNKHEIVDPMPSFQSVEQRLMDLIDRKLHPAYKKYEGLCKKPLTPSQREMYETYTNINLEKMEAEDIPKRIKFNKNLLDKKNLYSEFKRVEPPIQIVARLVEMEKNAKPTMEKRGAKNPPICRDQKAPEPEKKVFDTLQQKSEFF